jgi:hypothetical protein
MPGFLRKYSNISEITIETHRFLLFKKLLNNCYALLTLAGFLYLPSAKKNLHSLKDLMISILASDLSIHFYYGYSLNSLNGTADHIKFFYRQNFALINDSLTY